VLKPYHHLLMLILRPIHSLGTFNSDNNPWWYGVVGEEYLLGGTTSLKQALVCTVRALLDLASVLAPIGPAGLVPHWEGLNKPQQSASETSLKRPFS